MSNSINFTSNQTIKSTLKAARNITLLSLALITVLSINAHAETHCTKRTQADCTSKVLCKWKTGHKAGTPTKSDPTKMYKRNQKASCRKDTKAINTFLMSKFPKN